ncbi:iron complex outermembrane recepter protein [Tenacibaculum sp. MAR_2009_124]|uniref:TonB-dependent receptor n=1 Tax=Tenacibaculum sp. MAR_2009_124 TaxID=1250059 RepID=UPI00089679AC|nr:TonB-dependent receptor [Tenacibaculum sp. MAR_2009_124]SEB86548.1 iron complex outermembrane recepter protein [Tenacibaculum sp. MAR_2009_124]
MKKLVLCSVFMLLAIFANAQSNTTITGIVKDSKSGKGIPDVSITIKSLEKGTTTDKNGNFTITVSNQSGALLFSKVGYATRRKRVHSSSTNQTVNVQLQKKSIPLQEVTVNSNQNQLRKEVLNIGRLNVKDIDVPVTTNSVSSKIIEQRNVTDLGGAMKSATGVRPINRYGGFQTFRIRGFNNFVLLIDGVRDERHSLSTSAPTTNLANVERIEVLKGPASALYGHSALGGIINIVRKRPTYQNQGSFSASYGSFDTYNMSAGYGGAISDKLRYRTDFGMTRSNGWRDYGVETNNGSFMLEYTPSDKDKLEFYVQINSDKYDTDTGIPMDADGSLVPGLNPETRYNDPQDYLNHKRYDFQLKYSHKFNSNIELTNQVSYSSDDIDYLSTEFLVLNDAKDAITRDFPFYFNHQTKTLQNLLDFSYNTTTGNIQHKLLFGNSLSFLDRKTFRGSVIGPGVGATIAVQNPILNQGHIEPLDERVDIKEEFVSGFYIQDWIRFSDQLKALIGIRYDIFNGTYYRDQLNNNRVVTESGARTDIPKTAFTYRSGLVYQPLKNMSLFGSYSNFFKPSRRITVDGRVFDPETGYQVEAGLKFQKKNFITTTFSVYYLLKNNIVDGSNHNDLKQIGEADSKGFELDIESQPLKGLYIKAGYAYVDARVRSYDEAFQSIKSGNVLRFAPKNSGNLWATYEIQRSKLKGLGFGFGGNYVGENYTNSENTFKLPSYTTLDGTIYYETNKVRIGLNVNNLTDELYFTDAIYDNQFFVGQGRNFRLNLTYKF